MKILALEFSSARRSVAVLSGASAVAEAVETGGQGVRAFAMIERALREAGLEREQIECIAVGVGPGSYVGIRGAIALAQGWQLIRHVNVLAVSSAEGVAAQAAAEGVSGPIGPVIDAQRGEFYVATYDLKAEGAREISPLRLATAQEVAAVEAAGHLLVGPEIRKWFARGREVFPQAAALARLAAGRRNFVAGEQLEPIYLREATFVKAPPPRTLPG